MKKLFFSLIAMMIAVAGFAQTQLATLNHNGEIKTFYGLQSFKEAIAECDNGDVITLSSGRFIAADITKCITLRGAGTKENAGETNPHGATAIDGDFSITASNSDEITSQMYVEGIYFTGTITNYGKLNKPTFEKCAIAYFRDYCYYDYSDCRASYEQSKDGRITNGLFLHCRLNQIVIAGGTTLNFINSIVANPLKQHRTTTSGMAFTNCHVIAGSYLEYCSFTNCTIYKAPKYYVYNTGVYSAQSLSSLASATNSVCINDASYFNNLLNKSTDVAEDNMSIFKTEMGESVAMTDMCELTDEAKTKYLGNDGTQVGIYGGSLPFDEDPVAPKITKCNVASKSTADGKLSVEIEVKSAE